MAEENKIVLDADVKPLKKQLKEATLELQNARAKFGELSTEAVDAAKKVAGIRDSIEDANEQAQLFDPGKRFQALTSAASLAAGAVGAVQGAMGLFGAESEDVQKALLKVQSAMALSQGLSQLADLGKVTDQLKSSFKGLIGTTAQKTAATATDTASVVANTGANTAQAAATTASSLASRAAAVSLKVLRGAMISLGIPALIIGLVAVVQNFGAIKDAVLNAIPGLGKIASTIGGLVQGVTDFVGITSKANRELDALTKSTSARNQTIDTQIKLLTAQGGKEKEIFELKRKQTTQEIQDLIASDRLDGKTTEERQKRRTELLNNLTFETAAYNKKEADEAKAAAEKQAAEAKTRAEKAKAEQEKINEEKLAAEKKRLEEEKDLKEKTAEEDTEFQKRINEILVESRLASIKDENERVRAELIATQEQELSDLAEDTKLRAEQKLAIQKQLEIRNKEELDALDQSFAEADAVKELDDLDKEIAKADQSLQIEKNLLDQKQMLLQAQLDAGLISEQAFNQANAELTNARIELAQKEADAKVQLLQAVGQSLNVASDLVGKDTKAGKALGVASAAINTYQGIAAGVKLGYPAAIPAVAMAAATGFAAVKNILAVKVPGGSGGASAPSVNTSAPTTMGAVPTIGSSPVTALGTMMQNQPPLKAYVVESEVTGTQKRVADIERRAGF
jgi:hypothetical protein